MTRVLVLSHVFPRPSDPSFGIFVRRRVEHLARRLPVEVVAPLPWFPGGSWIGRTPRSAVPREATVGALRVHHPTVPSIPGIGRSLDGLSFAATLLPFLLKLRHRFPFDVIDAHFGYPDGVAAALLGRWLGCPVIITLRGFELDTARHPWRRRQLAWALRRSRVIGVSRELAALARELGAVDARVIPNGVDTELFSPGDRGEARRRLGLPNDRTILLSAAAFVPPKRHDRVLRAVARLRESGETRLHYVAVGRRGGAQSCLGQLRELAAELRIESQVQFVVDRPHEEMPLWFRAADLACLASEREGSPNGVLEALACGLPIVAVGAGEIPSMVRPGLDGEILQSFDEDGFARAIANALRVDWDRDQIAAHGAQRSWEDVTDEVVEEVQAATATPAGGS